jgi:L-ascorbate metabolism protein UlaG (beta-lactamase superfamily)
MQLQLIRNASMLLSYAGRRILTDPYFAPKHSRPSFAGKSPNPLVDLPAPPEQILQGVELVIVSHLHSDHFDPAAQELIPKTLPLLCQPGDEQALRDMGFSQATPVAEPVEWPPIRVARVGGHHGLGEVEAEMGHVSGFVLRAGGEPTVYWAGDTVLCDEVRAAIADFKPDVIITHSSGAEWPISGGARSLIVMDAAQTIEVCRLAPAGTVIAIHLDSLDHGTVSRSDLRSRARQAGIDPHRLLIPEDGDTLDIG